MSREADSLYALGRNLERAEHVARCLEKHVGLWLDRGSSVESGHWSGFLSACGWKLDKPPRGWKAIDLAVTDPEGPSVRASMARARRGALAVRPSLSSEVFDQINELYWRLEEADGRQDLTGLLTDVQLGISLVDGLIEESMAHDEPWNFLRLGKYMQRAWGVTRLVTVKMRQLEGVSDEQGEWAVVLRCCSAFEAYRWRYSAPVTPVRVTGFLLLDANLPRSARYCAREALESVARVDQRGQRSRPHRLLGQLAGMYEYTEEGEVTRDPDGFAGAFERLHGLIDDALSQTYFQPSKVMSESVAVPVWDWNQQQQQQQ